MSDTIERPISVSAAETKETHADRARPEGSYTGAAALADDSIRVDLLQKPHYPLRVANTSAPEYLSEEAKEARARDFAGENGKTQPKEMGEHPQWKNTDIPFSTLAPELVSDKEKHAQ